jgi:hypothetical protein
MNGITAPSMALLLVLGLLDGVARAETPATVIVRVRHLQLDEAASALRRFVTKDGVVSIDAGSASITITDARDNVSVVEFRFLDERDPGFRSGPVGVHAVVDPDGPCSPCPRGTRVPRRLRQHFTHLTLVPRLLYGAEGGGHETEPAGGGTGGLRCARRGVQLRRDEHRHVGRRKPSKLSRQPACHGGRLRRVGVAVHLRMQRDGFV